MVTVISQPPLRQELGNFASITCFKAMVQGLEAVLGPKGAHIALVMAGHHRGQQLATLLELQPCYGSVDEVTELVRYSLGKQGSRLCLVNKIKVMPNGYRVYCSETLCSAGEPAGSTRKLGYTLGVLQGVLEAVSGRRLRGQQVASVLQGSTQDILEFIFL
jgi:hypothetical protein